MSLEMGIPPPQFWESGMFPRGNFENIGANLCNVVHFGDIRSSKPGRKIDAFKTGTKFTVPAV